MSDFEYYLEMLSLRAGLPRDSIARQRKRYQEGRAELEGTTGDWNAEGFNLLTEAREDLDDVWIYIAKHLHNRKDDHTSKDFAMAMKLMAVVETLLNGQIAAQSAEDECDQTADAPSARPADGVPVRSEMACVGWWEDEEMWLYGL